MYSFGSCCDSLCALIVNYITLMNYSKNLNGHYVKSKKNFLVGIFLVLFCLTFSIYSFCSDSSTWFDRIFPLLLMTNGVFIIAQSRGHYLRKTFVEVNDDSLTIRTVSKTKSVFWENVERVDFSDKKLSVFPEDRNFQFVELKMLEDEVFNEIVENVSKVGYGKRD